ncbi:MAG: 50S ribosomal protein L6 [Gemmatimonadetes bacterium]|nr:50S ribosomal protein L6 [Gemmatimonadota bacterium]
MSRIGKIPVPIPSGVTLTIKDRKVEAKGPKGAESFRHHEQINVELKDNEVHVTRPGEERLHRALHGLTRTLVANLVEGVTKGYMKQLEINGVGYRANVEGPKLVLNLGYASPIDYVYPKGIQISVDNNLVKVEGTNKKTVGEVAAKIRSFRKPEPYNGKGVKYLEEVIVRKAGKATA